MERFLKERKIKIVYATQTGNARIVANEIYKLLMLYRLDIIIDVINVINYDITQIIDDYFVIFVISTTGYGEVPNSLKKLWESLLRKDLNDDLLENLNFTIFGLGDSSYELFNAAAVKFKKRLENLGANLLIKCALSDEQHDFSWEGEFTIWFDILINKIKKILKIKDDIKIDYKYGFQYKPDYEFIQTEENYQSKSYSNISTTDTLYSINTNETVLLSDNKLFEIETIDLISQFKESENMNFENNKNNKNDLDKLNDKLIFKLSLKTINNSNYVNQTNENLDLVPGDILNIYPVNSDKDVCFLNEIIDFSKFDIRTRILFNEDSFTKKEIKFQVNSDSNINNNIQNKIDLNKTEIIKESYLKHLNINGIPTKKFCYLMSEYTINSTNNIIEYEDLSEKLILFSENSFEGRNEFYRYCIKGKKSIIDVIHDFKIGKFKKIPFDVFVEAVGFVRAREFSVADFNYDSYKCSNRIDIIFSLHSMTNMFGQKKLGQVSEYLFDLFKKYQNEKSLINENMEINKSLTRKFLITTFISKGSFPIIDINKSYLLIATGTGVSPLLFFLKKRSDLLIKNFNSNISDKNKCEAKVTLYYGCRNQKIDSIELDYLNNLSNDKKFNFYLKLCLSRENLDKSMKNKAYVQHILNDNKEDLLDVFKGEYSSIILIGNSKILPKAIKSVFKNFYETSNNKHDFNLNLDNVYERIYIESW